MFSITLSNNIDAGQIITVVAGIVSLCTGYWIIKGDIRSIREAGLSRDEKLSNITKKVDAAPTVDDVNRVEAQIIELRGMFSNFLQSQLSQQRREVIERKSRDG
jgi:hypothetical protein